MTTPQSQAEAMATEIAVWFCYGDSAQTCTALTNRISTTLSKLIAERDENEADYNELVGLLKKRFPRREDGTYPDYAIEDVLKENEVLTLANELAEQMRVDAESKSAKLIAENERLKDSRAFLSTLTAEKKEEAK